MTWQPIETAPKDATEVLLLVEKDGVKHPLVAHWAYGGGEDQPSFGPAWFEWDGYGYRGIHGKPTHWAPIPEKPR